jgi:hypothetical protein
MPSRKLGHSKVMCTPLYGQFLWLIPFKDSTALPTTSASGIISMSGYADVCDFSGHFD